MNIKEMREAAGINQRQLAEAIGVDISTICRYETGKTDPPLSRILQITAFLKNPDGTDPSSPSGLNLVKNINLSDTSKVKNNLLYGMYENVCRQLIRLKANGKCELCGQTGPFTDDDGLPHLGVYKIDGVDNYNAEKNLIALCPNCNSRARTCVSPEEIEKIKKIAATHDFTKAKVSEY